MTRSVTPNCPPAGRADKFSRATLSWSNGPGPVVCTWSSICRKGRTNQTARRVGGNWPGWTTGPSRAALPRAARCDALTPSATAGLWLSICYPQRVARRRGKMVCLRLLPEELQMLRALAKRRGLSISDTLRQSIRHEHELLSEPPVQLRVVPASAGLLLARSTKAKRTARSVATSKAPTKKITARRRKTGVPR